jgi:hypothetical protein
MNFSSNVYVAILIFLIAVGSAANFIVYNEEIFILIDFCLFIIFAYKMISDVIANDLDDRITKIQAEFDAVQSLQIQKFEALAEVHTIRTTISGDLASLFDYVETELDNMTTLAHKALLADSTALLTQKFDFLVALEKSILSQLHERFALMAYEDTLYNEYAALEGGQSSNSQMIESFISSLFQPCSSYRWMTPSYIKKHKATDTLNTSMLLFYLINDSKASISSDAGSIAMDSNVTSFFETSRNEIVTRLSVSA